MPADTTAHSLPSRSAWPALEIVKCAGIVGMILVHVVSYFTTWAGALQVPDESFVLRWVRWGMLIGFLPLLLPVTAGCAFYLGLFSKLPAGRLSAGQLLGLVTTAGALIGIGYGVNVLELGWRHWFVWQILHFTGLSLLALALLAWRLPVAAIPVAGTLALLGAPWLRDQFGGSAALYRQALFESQHSINSWPFFPWFPLVAFGFTIAWARNHTASAGRFRAGLWTTGAALVAWALLRGEWLPPFDPKSISGLAMFNPPPGFVIGVMGVAALALALGEWIGDRVTLHRYGVVHAFSKGILWIYIVHLVLLHRFYMWLVGHFDMRAYASRVAEWPNLVALAATWLVLLAVSYGVGYAAIRFLQDRRIHVRLQRRR